MRKTSLFLGICYLLWSVWQYFTINRALSLYAQFNAGEPSNTYLMPALVFVIGIAFSIGYFINLKNKVIYKLIVICGITGIAIYMLYIFTAGSITNRQVYQMLDEVKKVK